MEQAPLCQSVNRHWVHPQIRRGLGAFESLFLDKCFRFRAIRLTDGETVLAVWSTVRFL